MSDKLEAAQHHADVSRARLQMTLAEIQHRLAPRNVLQEAAEGARVKSADLAESAARLLCERPGMVTAAIAGITVLLARRPLLRLGRAMFGARETTDDNRSFTA